MEKEKLAEIGKPILQTSFRKSKDGKYFITRVTITTIKPVKYIEKVMQGSEVEEELELLGEE
jgi:hypothetical protein